MAAANDSLSNKQSKGDDFGEPHGESFSIEWVNAKQDILSFVDDEFSEPEDEIDAVEKDNEKSVENEIA